MAKASDIEGLDCAAGARDGIALVLRTRLAEMCALRTAALDWSDPEGVHDMRVASRRLRSALRDIAPYVGYHLPSRRLRRLAAALGAVRDDDVVLMALAALAGEADADMTEGLNLLSAARQQRREQARNELALALAETALDELQAKFLHKLTQTAAAQASNGGVGTDNAAAPAFDQVGREIIAGLLAELCDGGRALYQPHSVKRIHQLRIIAKRLRYALELFAQCWGERLTVCADEIAALQKSLGELHDCDVWIAELGALLKRLSRRHEPDPTDVAAARAAERKAAVWLLSRFVKDRAKHFRDALAGWESLEANDFRAQLLIALLRPSEGVEAQASAQPDPSAQTTNAQ